MYVYYNANPKGRIINDCTIRAISLAMNISWEEAYYDLSKYACEQCLMLDDVNYIDNYLSNRFDMVCFKKKSIELTVGDFVKKYNKGTYLITLSGHITCCIDGIIYDTFNPSNNYVWCAYRVK